MIKFSKWLESKKVIPWGDAGAMMAYTADQLKANPHAQKVGGPIKMAPPAGTKKIVPPVPAIPKKN